MKKNFLLSQSHTIFCLVFFGASHIISGFLSSLIEKKEREREREIFCDRIYSEIEEEGKNDAKKESVSKRHAAIESTRIFLVR